MNDDDAKPAPRKRPRRSLRVPVDEVPRPTRAAGAAAIAPELLEDGGSTMEMPAFEEGRATLEDVSAGIAPRIVEEDDRSSDEILLTEADEVPSPDARPRSDSVEVDLDPTQTPPEGAPIEDPGPDDAGEPSRAWGTEDEHHGAPAEWRIGADPVGTLDDDDRTHDEPAPPPPAVVTASVVVVSRVVSVLSAPGAVAPPPPEPEPDTLVGADVDLDEPEVVFDESDDEDADAEEEDGDDHEDLEVEVEVAAAAPAAEPRMARLPSENAVTRTDELVEVADADARGAAKAPSKPPPPPGKPAAPPPPREPEAKAKSKEKPKPEAAKQKRKPRRQWWDGLFNDDYLRTVPIPHPRTIQQQCDFIEQRFGLAPGATLLDVGCGLGLHAVELTRRGYLVVGLDLSLPMLSRAADEAQEHGFKINFLHADMREMNFEGAFDAVLCWGTTFGYFDDEGNRQVVERLYRALKPRGLLLLDVVNRDYVIVGQPNLVWFEGDGCVVMEETQMNYITSRLEVKRTVILDDGRQRDARYTLRLYSLHELGQVLHHRGFRVVEVSGREAHPGVYFGADSPKLIILAERRPQGPPPPALGEGGGGGPPAPPSRFGDALDGDGEAPAMMAMLEPTPSDELDVPDEPSAAVSDAMAGAIEQSEEELAELLDTDLEPDGE